MIRSALIALGLSAGAAQGQGLVQSAPLLEPCGGARLVLSAIGDETDDSIIAQTGVMHTQGVDDAVTGVMTVCEPEGAPDDPAHASDNDTYEQTDFSLNVATTFQQKNRGDRVIKFDAVHVVIGADDTGDVIAGPVPNYHDGLNFMAFTSQDVIQVVALCRSGMAAFDASITAQEVMDGSDPSADFCP